MKQFWATFGGQIAGYFAAIATVGLVGFLIWRKLFGAQTPAGLIRNVQESAASIPSGLSSLIESKFLGQSEDTYVSQEQARKDAQAELLRRQREG